MTTFNPSPTPAADTGTKRSAFARIRSPRTHVAPGIELDDLSASCAGDKPVTITSIDYGPEHHQTEQVRPADIDEFISRHRPDWSLVRWINVNGLSDLRVVHALARKYNLHPLAIEDVLGCDQRPKAEPYDADGELQARVFVLMRMIELVDGHVRGDQISLFLGHKTVLTFQHEAGDVWDPIRARIAKTGTRLRTSDASFLAYSLIDATVDHCFPILENFGDRLEELEGRVMDTPTRQTLQQVYQLKRELLLLRRSVWPLRELIHSLQRESHECFSEMARTYLRDVYDHVVQIIDVIETYREMAIGLTETYMNVVGNRMNEIMKVLTIIGTIFIPLTFLAGVYGMNFHHMPELEERWAYPVFWVICGLVAAAMIAWFRKRKWL